MTEQTRERAASLLEEKQLPTDKLRHLLLQLGTNLAGPATPEQLVRIIVQSSSPERVHEYVERLFESSGATPTPPKKGKPTRVEQETSKAESKSTSESKHPEVAPPPLRPRPEPVARETSAPPPPQEKNVVPMSNNKIKPVVSESSKPREVEKTPEAPKRRLEDSLSESPINIQSFPQSPGPNFKAFAPVAMETEKILIAAAAAESTELGGTAVSVGYPTPGSQASVMFPETPAAGSFPETPMSRMEFPETPLPVEFPQTPLPVASASSDEFDTLTDAATFAGPRTSQSSVSGEERRTSQTFLTEEERFRRISAGSQGSQISLTGVDMPIHLSEEERARRASDVERQEAAQRAQEETSQEEESQESKEEAAARSRLVMAQEDLEKVQRMQARAEEVVASERDARANRRASIDLAVELAEQERQRRIQEQAAKAGQTDQADAGEESERERRVERRRSVDLAVELAEAERLRRITEESERASTTEKGEDRPRAAGRKSSGIAHLISQYNTDEQTKPRSSSGSAASSDTAPQRKGSDPSTPRTAPPPPQKQPKAPPQQQQQQPKAPPPPQKK